MNLIYESWIPIRRLDGTRDKIAPWYVTDFTEGKSPIVAIASPRPDFDGSLVQFLIGLLQTTCTPSESEWWDWREKPPRPETLRERFATVTEAFELKAPIAFMQDFSPSDLSKKLDIADLLIESPGEKTQKDNTDHFIKRGRVEQICLHCAATALITLQTNAPSGGKGYRTSLRGGGPLSTLVLGDILWETCWRNVLNKARYLNVADPNRSGVADRFPWLASTRTSEPTSRTKTTGPVDVHPDQHFWAMPRRIRLQIVELSDPSECDLCGAEVTSMCRHFDTKNYGVNYEGFEHPLSPHYVTDGVPSPVHPQPGGIGYRHWLGLVENTIEGNRERRPAKVIEQFRSLAREDARLWAFGFDIVSGQDKPRCWYDATMPILHMEGDQAAILSSHLGNMVKAARYVSGLVMSAVLKATLLDAKKTAPENGEDRFHIIWKWPKDILAKLKRTPTEKAEGVEAKVNASGEALEARIEKSLLSAPLAARSQFWASTEPSFFQRAKEMREMLHAGGNEARVLEAWKYDMEMIGRLVFRGYTQPGDFDADDPRRAALAQYELDQRMNGPKLRILLGLPHAHKKIA